MSIFVRGMTMPASCACCDLCVAPEFVCESYCCAITGETMQESEAEQGRKKSCPLVEVAVPHGRLIDADAANEVMMYEMCGTGYQSRATGVLESDFYTPTIIAAEQ